MTKYTTLYGRQGSTENAVTLSSLPSASSETIVQGSQLDSTIEPPNPSENPHHVSKQSWLEVLLRAMSFSILWNAFAHRPRIELGKQAICKSRLLVCMTLSTHFLPISACIVLFVLNLRGYYVRELGPASQNEVILNTLQFVAKLHELLMQASLSLVVVAFTRHELTVGRGVPLGAIFGSLQLSQLNYLWSKELTGTWKARTGSLWTRWWLVALIFVGAIQFATVGPSSAILMRPRLDDWPVGGTAFYLNATKEQIWPSMVDAKDIPPECATISTQSPFECLSKHSRMIRDDIIPFWHEPTQISRVIPKVFNIPSRVAMRTLSLTRIAGESDSRWTLATVQMSNFADIIADIGQLWMTAADGHKVFPSLHYSKQFKLRRDVAYTIDDLYQPLTEVVCNPLEDAFGSIDDIWGPVNLDTYCNYTRGLSKHFTTKSYDNPVEMIPIAEHVTNATSTSPRLRFVDLPEKDYGSNSVGAFISFPPSWPGGKSVQACTIDARWALTSISSRQSRVQFASSEPPGWLNGTCTLPSAKRIKISQEWANLLNPVVQEDGHTVFEKILKGLPANNASQWRDFTDYTSPLMEVILSVLITNGLATQAASAVPQGHLKGCTPRACGFSCRDGEGPGKGAWCQEIMPKEQFGPGGDIYDLPPDFNASESSQYRVHVDINGYAYNSRGTTALLACAILMLYCLLALSHSFFSLWSGLSSQSWDTIAEVVALAMQSKPTAALKNTCAGIVSTTIFTNLVRVAESGIEREHLELIFEADHDYEAEEAPKRLQPDKFYF